jgi:hypothetical protein
MPVLEGALEITECLNAGSISVCFTSNKVVTDVQKYEQHLELSDLFREGGG